MKRYRVAVTRNAISRKNRASGDWETPAFNRVVLANRPTEAAAKCAAEIWQLCDEDIKVVSCYVGRPGSVTGSASRMHPIQIRR